MGNELLTTGQIAAEQDVDRTTVHYWVKAGKLVPTQVVNGIRLFDRAEVDRFLAARDAEQAPTDPVAS